LGDAVAVEIKSAKKVQASFFKGLKALQEEGLVNKFILVSNDPVEKVTDGILCLPWQRFL
jgi:hypothetical protein